MYYDFWNQANDKKLLKQLGFTPIDIKITVISPKTVPELRKLTQKYKDPEFLLLHKPNEKVLRAAIQACSIDATDAFVEYPLIKKMSERNIAVLLNFNELLNSRFPKTSKLMYLMTRTVRLAKKYKTPIMITSGAVNKYDMRSISELTALGENLKMTAGQAKRALYVHQQKILERNKLKKAGKWVISGVKVV